ncbi:hypothetical protein, partial [Paraburkholderia solitsugae]|uniref:hypothetical protein n=1 Tax=Paraburkholderia solitsugae TaxID=2675748 RepID=UPI001C12D9ED
MERIGQCSAMFPDPAVTTDKDLDEKSRREHAIAVVMARLEAKPRFAPAFCRRLLRPLSRTVNAKTPPFGAGFLDMLGSLT